MKRVSHFGQLQKKKITLFEQLFASHMMEMIWSLLV
jgi:hypothetical protein